MGKNNLENVETVPINIVGVVIKAREVVKLPDFHGHLVLNFFFLSQQCNGSVGVAKQDVFLLVAAGGHQDPIISKPEEVEKEVENPPKSFIKLLPFLFRSKWS